MTKYHLPLTWVCPFLQSPYVPFTVVGLYINKLETKRTVIATVQELRVTLLEEATEGNATLCKCWNKGD